MSPEELRRFIAIDGHVGLEEEEEHAARFRSRHAQLLAAVLNAGGTGSAALVHRHDVDARALRIRADADAGRDEREEKAGPAWRLTGG